MSLASASTSQIPPLAPLDRSVMVGEPLFGDGSSGSGIDVSAAMSGGGVILGASPFVMGGGGAAAAVAAGSPMLLQGAGLTAGLSDLRCSFLQREGFAELLQAAGEAARPALLRVVQAAESSLREKDKQLRSAKAEVEQAHVNVGQLLSDIQERRGPDFQKMYRELKREHDGLMLNCVKLSADVERLRRTNTAISVLSGEDASSLHATGVAGSASGMSFTGVDGGVGSSSAGDMSMGDGAVNGLEGEQALRPADVFNDIAALLDEMDRKMNFDKNAVGLEDLQLLQEFLQALLEMQEQERTKAELAITSIRIDMERVQERCDLLAARQQAEQAEQAEQAARQAVAALRNPFGGSLPPIELPNTNTGQKRRGETQMSMSDLDAEEDGMSSSSSSSSASSSSSSSSSGMFVSGVSAAVASSSSAAASMLGGGSSPASKAAQEKRRQLLLTAKKRRVRENLQSLKDSFQRGGDGGHLEQLARTLRNYTHFTEAFPVATFRFGQSSDEMSDAASNSTASAAVTDSQRHISAIRFDTEEEFFAICGRNGQLAVHSHQVSMVHGADPEALAPLQVLQSRNALTDLCWSPFAKGQLATSDDTGQVVLWDAQTGSRLQTYRDHRGPAHAVHYSPQAQHLFASASQDRTVNIYHTTQTAATASIEMTQPVLAVRFNPLLENELCFGSADSNLYVYDIRNTKEAVRVLSQHRGPVNSVCLVGREELLSQSYDGSLLYWEGGQAVREYSGHVHKHSVNLGLDSKGDFFATGSENNSVVVYSRELQHPMISHSFNSGFQDSDKLAYVSALCWKASSNVLVAGNSNGIVKVIGLR
jgi:WD40 repeat protein